MLSRGADLRVDHLDVVPTKPGVWYLPRRGTQATDVHQASFPTLGAALDRAGRWVCKESGWDTDSAFRSCANGLMLQLDGRPTGWYRSADGGSERSSFYETNRDGDVLRCVEFVGLNAEPIGAAVLSESIEDQRGVFQPQTPLARRREWRFGALPHDRLDPAAWECADISAGDFEVEFEHARERLSARPAKEYWDRVWAGRTDD